MGDLFSPMIYLIVKLWISYGQSFFDSHKIRAIYCKLYTQNQLKLKLYFWSNLKSPPSI